MYKMIVCFEIRTWRINNELSLYISRICFTHIQVIHVLSILSYFVRSVFNSRSRCFLVSSQLDLTSLEDLIQLDVQNNTLYCLVLWIHYTSLFFQSNWVRSSEMLSPTLSSFSYGLEWTTFFSVRCIWQFFYILSIYLYIVATRIEVIIWTHAKLRWNRLKIKDEFC
jgi:flagellar biosynthesis protein FlhB